MLLVLHTNSCLEALGGHLVVKFAEDPTRRGQG